MAQIIAINHQDGVTYTLLVATMLPHTILPYGKLFLVPDYIKKEGEVVKSIIISFMSNMPTFVSMQSHMLFYFMKTLFVH